MHENDEQRKKLLNRLNRIRGQVDAVSRMIENDSECVEIIMQISAATGALSKVAQLLLREHLEGSLADAAESNSDEEREAIMKELITLFEKYASAK
ncbi:metal-sensitive transcriptional regulator [Crateriforma spongiae]|uniref:metal-sensitive transcriptional regulator n=1 Tax=Crateriforma spongiae TaxID=2724528 RepID=UPI001446F59F|nr:metal-sensitive transcriptional regulator [Crateriforma spongiae]